MSTHNIGFYKDLTKIIFQLSSNTQLISSADHNINTPVQFTAILTSVKMTIFSRKMMTFFLCFRKTL